MDGIYHFEILVKGKHFPRSPFFYFVRFTNHLLSNLRHGCYSFGGIPESEKLGEEAREEGRGV